MTAEQRLLDVIRGQITDLDRWPLACEYCPNEDDRWPRTSVQEFTTGGEACADDPTHVTAEGEAVLPAPSATAGEVLQGPSPADIADKDYR